VSSSYLKNIRSLEELDALLEEEKKRASTNGKKLIKEYVPQAIDAIDRFCNDSVFRIEEKSKQTIARFSSFSETTIAAFLNETEIARHQITRIMEGTSDQRTLDIVVGMVSETSHHYANRISDFAKDSIDEIRLEASRSILELRQKTADAFKDFRALTARVVKQIRETVEGIGNTFEAVKKAPKNQRSFERAKKDTEKAVADTESAFAEIDKAKERTIKRINDSMDAASRRIEQSQEDAIHKIRQAKGESEAKLKEIAETVFCEEGAILGNGSTGLLDQIKRPKNCVTTSTS